MMTRRQWVTLAGAGVLVPAASVLALVGGERRRALTLQPTELDLAGTKVVTWGYDGQVPGPGIVVTEGDVLEVPVMNALPEASLVHWHGVAIENAMDGTHLTQSPIAPGERFTYRFTVPDSGTHWYHAHSGAQADKGLYGPLIVQARSEPHSYDRDYTLILDDWADGVRAEPADNDSGGVMGGYGSLSGLTMSETPEELISFGGRAYPFILVNGKPTVNPAAFEVRRGERARLRFINAASDTGFRVAIGGHSMTVTHADGMPVKPVTVQAMRIGMGERFDVLVDAVESGQWQIAVLPEGKEGFGRALLGYSDASLRSVPPADFRPAELEGRLLTYGDLVGLRPPRVPERGAPDRHYEMTLRHTGIIVDGLAHDEPIRVRSGDWVRFSFVNESDIWHPMHLHGHHFHLGTLGRPLKDTAVIAARGGTMTWDWRADNPGAWMIHCHNTYHHADGMIREIYYDLCEPPNSLRSKNASHNRNEHRSGQ